MRARLRLSGFLVALKVIVGRRGIPIGIVGLDGTLNDGRHVVLSRSARGEQHDDKRYPRHLLFDGSQK